MAGFDRSQAELISSVEMKEALRQLVQAQTLTAQYQLELLALLRDKNKKAPSIFKAGSFFDFAQLGGKTSIGSYPLPKGGVASDAYYSQNTVGSVPNVYVLPIEDADLVRLSLSVNNFYSTSGLMLFPTAFAPPTLLFALSPWDMKNPITAEQFTACRSVTGWYAPGDLVSQVPSQLAINIWDEIPCAGNKYIHMFAIWNGNDLLSTMITEKQYQGDQPFMLNYSLIK